MEKEIKKHSDLVKQLNNAQEKFKELIETLGYFSLQIEDITDNKHFQELKRRHEIEKDKKEIKERMIRIRARKEARRLRTGD